MNKQVLYDDGVRLASKFLEANALPLPIFRTTTRRFGSCGAYRPGRVLVSIKACAAPGRAGRCWSWPGYPVDRTPYGVVAHECGHHLEHVLGKRAPVVEAPLTGYHTNASEWFAEMAKLFITNPSLLQILRPRTYIWLAHRVVPAEKRDWSEVLADAPLRTINATVNRIRKARKS